MRSKDLAKAAGLAVAFDHTAPTFYRVSRFLRQMTYFCLLFKKSRIFATHN